MALFDHDGLIEDAWLSLTDNEAPAPGQRVVVPLRRLLDEGLEPLVAAAALGVRVQANERVEDLTPWLGRLGLIALEFPAMGDGRAFSSAALLRRRMGYARELRAVGKVRVDLRQFMRRVGFDTFEVEDGRPLRSWLDACNSVALSYQPQDAGEGGVTHVWRARRRQEKRAA